MQNNSEKEFSDLLKNRLDQEEMSYGDDLWENTFARYQAAKAGERKRRGAFWLKWGVAALVVLSGIATIVHFTGKDKDPNKISAQKEEASEQPGSSAGNKDAHTHTAPDAPGKDQATPEEKATTAPGNATAGNNHTGNTTESPGVKEKTGGADKPATGRKSTHTGNNEGQKENSYTERGGVRYDKPAVLAGQAKGDGNRTGEGSGEKGKGTGREPKENKQPVIAEKESKADPSKGQFNLVADNDPELDLKSRDKTPEDVQPVITAGAGLPAATPDSSRKEKPFFNKWQFGLAYERNSSFRDINVVGPGVDPQYINKRESKESAMSSNSAFAFARFNLNKYVGFQTGIGYVQTAYRCAMGRYQIVVMDSTPVYDQMGNIVGYQPYPKDKLYEFYSENYFNFITVPLQVNVTPFTYKRFSVTANIGINGMFLVYDHGITLNPYTLTPVKMDKDKEVITYNPLHLSMNYGFALNAFVTRHIQLSVQPVWRRSLNSLYSDDFPVRERLRSKGINFSIAYGF